MYISVLSSLSVIIQAFLYLSLESESLGDLYQYKPVRSQQEDEVSSRLIRNISRLQESGIRIVRLNLLKSTRKRVKVLK